MSKGLLGRHIGARLGFLTLTPLVAASCSAHVITASHHRSSLHHQFDLPFPEISPLP